MENDNKIISSFYVKDSLNPEIWDNYDDKKIINEDGE